MRTKSYVYIIAISFLIKAIGFIMPIYVYALDELRARSFSDRLPRPAGIIMSYNFVDESEKIARLYFKNIQPGTQVIIGFKNGMPRYGTCVEKEMADYETHSELLVKIDRGHKKGKKIFRY